MKLVWSCTSYSVNHYYSGNEVSNIFILVKLVKFDLLNYSKIKIKYKIVNGKKNKNIPTNKNNVNSKHYGILNN